MRNTLLALPLILALFLCAGFSKSVAPAWEDLQFPLNGINPVGPATAPTLSTADGLWDFSGSTDNVAVFWLQMPHGWSLSKPVLDPHLHWMNGNTTNASAVFELKWICGSPFADFSGDWEGSSTIVLNTGISTATHHIDEFSDFTPSNPKHSMLIKVQLSRLASSDARDNHTGTIRVGAFDTHYLREANGSFAQYGDSQ